MGRKKKGVDTNEDELNVKPVKVSKIDKWKPKKEDLYATYEGKVLIFDFARAFGRPNLAVYNRFFVDKTSYEKQLGVISHYINFFVTFYDEDNEFKNAYVKIKMALDKYRIFGPDNMSDLINLIYLVLFSPTMVEKIRRMVEDNYVADIEEGSNEKYVNKEKRHLESLEFNNKHMKVLHAISFAMKIIAPILFHYTKINIIKIEKDSDIIFKFYKRLFPLFSGPDMNIYNKLFVYVKTKVLDSKSHNSPIFEQRDILGVDQYLVIRSFLQKVIISENIVKYKLNENVIGFNKTIVKYQLMYFLKEQHDKNLTEVTNSKNSDGLSGLDKMSMNLSKIDEGAVIYAEVMVEDGIARILRDRDYNITQDEINYYLKYHNPSDEQITLVTEYWSSYFGSPRNLDLIDPESYMKLMLILKRELIMIAGGRENQFSSNKLAYLLSGNIETRVHTKLLRNSRFTASVAESYLYKKLIEEKYKNILTVRPEYLLQLLNSIINSHTTYVVYEKPELLGTPIEYNEEEIADEALFFLNMI